MMTVRATRGGAGKSTTKRQRPIIYPTGDGKPMAETDYHRDEMVRCISTLDRCFAARPDVYVSGNLFLYYEEGNPRAVVSPDTLVVFGVPKGKRDTFKVWEEGGKLPSAVFEITSRKTRREDEERKYELYERLGIPEYFFYDVLGDYLAHKLRGYRLTNGRYQPIAPEADGSLISVTLGLRLRLVDGWLRFFDQDGHELLSKEEQGLLDAQRADEAEERAAATRAHADQLAARAATAEQHAEAEAARADAEAARAEAEAAQRAIAEQRAEAEATARAALEAENARLRALLNEREQS